MFSYFQVEERGITQNCTQFAFEMHNIILRGLVIHKTKIKIIKNKK